MDFSAILSDHLTRYPLMQTQDVYKLIHQAVCGPAHAITNRDVARKWLENELETLSDPYPEPLIDPISPDGKMVRVHLAPYKFSDGDPGALLDAFIRTSHAVIPDYERLEEFCLIANRRLVPSLKGLLEIQKARGYPALHHSDQYRRTYKPAYRVVLEKYLGF